MDDLANNNPSATMEEEEEAGIGAKSDDELMESNSIDYDFDEDFHGDESEDEDEDDYDYFASQMESYFDDLDCPTGVEVSVQFSLDDDNKSIQPQNNTQISSSKVVVTDIDDQTQINNNIKELQLISSTTLKEDHNNDHANKANSSGSSSSTTVEAKLFPTFDFVDDIPDHYYFNSKFKPTNKNWTKVIQDEWKSLKTGLPETIFVRVSESRMELLRAVIVGPPGTPYHDGLFTFDCIFCESYPYKPPSVYYYSSGLRINPNLYNNGKVCLSLLGTWEGKNKCENWEPGRSTMLQVLVSIQALILNAQPYFNEPGFEITSATPEGDRASQRYNETALILSFKTMLYTMRNPPMHFKDLVVHHFQNRAQAILVACEAYSKGQALAGSEIINKNQSTETTSGSSKFKTEVSQMMKLLLTSFLQNGYTPNN
ncbi:putative ubiquitin-conjugating enzyme E2 38 [Humulus lupulus]|uniref:putative ubiquitin-conjugating enzyme E2 38 n=1 Tax=Humulus lupulus TaxID=3486 RepID=UPI002B40E2D2|nr:putative ubiquitin-conjugating enzyme E2 38 [Humulus lupulus]